METQPTGQDAFMQALQDKLMQSADMISSANSGLDQKISSAISGISSANASSTAAITSAYDRTISYQNEKDQNAITAARERGVGMSTSDVAYKAAASEADKNIKDLEQRKQELILQGNASAAAKISDLQIQTLEFKTKALQQTFSNLMSIGSFGLQYAADKREQQAQDFTQKSAIAGIALKYGIPVSENDTMASIVAKAAPYASAEQKAGLAKLVAETNRANAEAARASREGKVTANLSDPVNRQAYISMALSDPTTFNKLLVQNPQLASIRNDAQTLQTNAISNKVSSMVKSGVTDYATIKANIEEDQSLGAQIDILANDKIILDTYTKAKAERDSSNTRPYTTLPQDVYSAYNSYSDSIGSILQYITGYSNKF